MQNHPEASPNRRITGDMVGNGPPPHVHHILNKNCHHLNKVTKLQTAPGTEAVNTLTER